MRRKASIFIRIDRSVRWISRALNWCAVVSVTIMMVLTVLDVVLRFFRRPITGTYEIVGLLGAVFVSFSLAYTSLQRGHIAVDFLVQRLKPSAQKMVEGVTSLVCAVLFGFAAWQSVLFSGRIHKTGEISLTLQVPLYPFVIGMSIGCSMLCVVLIMRFAGSIVQEKTGRTV